LQNDSKKQKCKDVQTKLLSDLLRKDVKK